MTHFLTNALLSAALGIAVIPNSHAALSAASDVQGQWDSTGALLWSSDSGQTLTWGAGFDFSGSSVAQSTISVNDTIVDSRNDFQFDWTDTSAPASFSGAAGVAHALGSTSDSHLLAHADATAGGAGGIESRGYSAHAGRFTVHGGPGTITFTFPYAYQFELHKLASQQGAYASLQPIMSLENYGPDPAHNPRPYVPLTEVYDYGTYLTATLDLGGATLSKAVSDSGVMQLSLFFNGEDKGYFAIGYQVAAATYAPTAPVPLPGTALLLGASVLALTVVRRRSVNA